MKRPRQDRWYGDLKRRQPRPERRLLSEPQFTCSGIDYAKAFQLFYHRLEDNTYLTSWNQVLSVALGNKEGNLGFAVRLVRDN